MTRDGLSRQANPRLGRKRFRSVLYRVWVLDWRVASEDCISSPAAR